MVGKVQTDWRDRFNTIFVGFVAIVPIGLAILIATLDAGGFIDDKILMRAILALLVALTASELVSKTLKLDSIHAELTSAKRLSEEVVSNVEKIHTNLVGEFAGLKQMIESEKVDIQTLVQGIGSDFIVRRYVNPKEWYKYFAKVISEANREINHIALSNLLDRQDSEEYREYEGAIVKAVESQKIEYIYVAVLRDERRRQRVKELLANPKSSKYRPYIIQRVPEELPLPNFLIVDQELLVLGLPNFAGQNLIWLEIRQREIVNRFHTYSIELQRLGTLLQKPEDMDRF